MKALAAFAAAIAAAIALLAWIAGRVCSDRYGWSQWLLWIPTPFAVAACLLAVPFVMRRRRLLIGWVAVGAVLVGYFALVEHRFVRRAPSDPTGLRILNWNASQAGRANTDVMEPWLIEADPDVAVLSGAPAVTRQPGIEAWLLPDGRSLRMGRFAILTRVPVVDVGWAVAAEEMRIAYVRLDTDIADRPLVLYLVDLPSDPRQPRAATAAAIRRYLSSSKAPAPDIVLGDFNMTRGSASLRRLFPGFRHAFDEAGTGYGATYGRKWPLYHIDHVLLGSDVEATGYELLDPGVTRHRAQMVTVDGR